MFKLKMAVIVSLALCSQVANANFVGGIPAGWVCTGTCNAAPADGVVTTSPLGSSQFGYVTTVDGATGVSPFALGGNQTGSKLVSNTFSAAAGDALNFYFNYVTSDGAGFADYAWARLLNSDGSQSALLFTARTQPSGNIIPGQGLPTPDAAIPTATIVGGGPVWSALGSSSGSCYASGCGFTGWVLSSFSIVASGDYKLEFGVINWNDSAFQSGLAFDGVTIAGVPIDQVNAIPLPGAVWLFGSALAGYFGFGRRKSI